MYIQNKFIGAVFQIQPKDFRLYKEIMRLKEPGQFFIYYYGKSYNRVIGIEK